MVGLLAHPWFYFYLMFHASDRKMRYVTSCKARDSRNNWLVKRVVIIRDQLIHHQDRQVTLVHPCWISISYVTLETKDVSLAQQSSGDVPLFMNSRVFNVAIADLSEFKAVSCKRKYSQDKLEPLPQCPVWGSSLVSIMSHHSLRDPSLSYLVKVLST